MQNTRLHTCLAHGTGDPQLTDFDYEAEKILMTHIRHYVRTLLNATSARMGRVH
jgi:hypothetical protein